MNNDKFEYVTNIFHELKSPLTTIMLACDIVKAHEVADTDSYLTMISNECKRMKSVIDSAIISMKNNYFDVDLNQNCDIHEILSKVVTSTNTESVGLYMMAVNHNVLGNIEYFESAFRELLENSRKYRSELPLHVSVRTFNKGDTLKICFSDNGSGIQNKYKDKIFEKGFTKNYSNETIDNQSNTGLGLFYLKQNIQRMKGTITVESKPGKGAIFTLTLPLII